HGAPSARAIDEALERIALHELHDHGARAVDVRCVEHADQVGVDEVTAEPHLVLEHREEDVGLEPGPDALERDALDLAVLEDGVGEPDLGHAAAADEIERAIADRARAAIEARTSRSSFS